MVPQLERREWTGARPERMPGVQPEPTPPVQPEPTPPVPQVQRERATTRLMRFLYRSEPLKAS
jgi:hypothetical protein